MLKRIRAEMAGRQGQILLQGIVEADETYIGGKPRKRNKPDNNNNLPPPPHNPRGRGTRKTPVIGAVERGGKVIARVASDLSGKGVLQFIEDSVDPDVSLLVTDEYRAYNAVRSVFVHATVNHSRGEYVSGENHTNTIEGFWSLLKRAWYGSHHHYSTRHMPLYVAEACWKYNRRKTENLRISSGRRG